MTTAVPPTTHSAGPHHSWTAVLPQVLGWVGAALVLSAALSLVGQSWDTWSDVTRLLVLVAALIVLVAPAVTVLLVTGGRAAVDTDDARRRIVAVLLALSAPLVAATAYWTLTVAGVDDEILSEQTWALIPAFAGLIAAVTAAWLARGVMTTLAVAAMWAFTGITLLSLFSSQPDWVLPVIVAGVGAVWLAVAPRVLTPVPLTEALGVAWTVAMLAPVALMESRIVDPDMPVDEIAASWVGRGLLLVFALVAFGVFARSGHWAWAVGGVIAAALAALAIAGSALGWIAGMLVAGVVLIAVSGLLMLARRPKKEPVTSAPAN